MKVFHRLILLFVLLSLFSAHSFAKKKETKAQTPPVLDGIWDIKFGDSIDTVRQKMHEKVKANRTWATKKNVACELIYEVKKNVTYEKLSVSEVHFWFDRFGKLEEIYIYLKPEQFGKGKKECPDEFMPEKYSLKYINSHYIRETLSDLGNHVKLYKQSDDTEIRFYSRYDRYDKKKYAKYSISFTAPHPVFENVEEVSKAREGKTNIAEGLWNIRFGDSKYLIKDLLEYRGIYRYSYPTTDKSLDDSSYEIYYGATGLTYGSIPVSFIGIIFDDRDEAVMFKIYFEQSYKYWNTFCDLVNYLKEEYSFELVREVGDLYVGQFYVSYKELCNMIIRFRNYDDYTKPYGDILTIKGRPTQNELQKMLDKQQKKQNEYNNMKNDL
ncbi:MAG: hypothetical protein J6X67_03195 [Treponema sp.]|nr:hypothetical protein [Treponema sp.]